MDDLLAGYTGDTEHSIAPLKQVVDGIVDEPALFSQLISGLEAESSAVQHRAAAAVSEVTALEPHLLKSHESSILETAATTTDDRLQEHLAGVIPKLALANGELEEATDILTQYTDSANMIVVVEAVDALAELARRYPACEDRVRTTLESVATSNHSFVETRATRALATLDDEQPG